MQLITIDNQHFMSQIIVLLLLFLVGFVIVALPDSDIRLFSISKDHGPSLQDAIGLVLILFAYTCLVVKAWKQKDKVWKYRSSIFFTAGLFLFSLGLGILIISILNDYKFWWVCGSVLMVMPQAAVFYLTLKH